MLVIYLWIDDLSQYEVSFALLMLDATNTNSVLVCLLMSFPLLV